jgi:hypothetical protein
VQIYWSDVEHCYISSEDRTRSSNKSQCISIKGYSGIDDLELEFPGGLDDEEWKELSRTILDMMFRVKSRK